MSCPSCRPEREAEEHFWATLTPARLLSVDAQRHRASAGHTCPWTQDHGIVCFEQPQAVLAMVRRNKAAFTALLLKAHTRWLRTVEMTSDPIIVSLIETSMDPVGFLLNSAHYLAYLALCLTRLTAPSTASSQDVGPPVPIHHPTAQVVIPTAILFEHDRDELRLIEASIEFMFFHRENFYNRGEAQPPSRLHDDVFAPTIDFP